MLITGYPADVNLLPDLPHVGTLTFQRKAIETYINEAGGPQLRFALDWGRRSNASSITSPNGLDPGHLQSALSLVLPSGPSTAVGLLFGDTLADDPVLGLDASQYGFMFDLSGDAATGTTPRLGCAVFLVPILLKARDEGLDEAATREFIAFTAIHELGHVFNLWHSQDGGFMVPNPDPAAPLGNQFDDRQKSYLKLMEDPIDGQYVVPGGSNFGDRPGGFPSGPGADPAFEGPANSLNLRVQLSHAAFWSFEPVELFVELSVTRTKRAVAVVDQLHPSYPGFEIWITDPNGGRFRFRPQSFYCRRGREVRLKPGETLHREVWIGSQSGRLTFKAPGPYQLQVQFGIGKGRQIQSNTLDFEVLPAAPHLRQWRDLKTLVSSRTVEDALRFKRRLAAADYARLVRALDLPPSQSTRRCIDFALGSALRRLSQSAAQPRGAELRHLSVRHLLNAGSGETSAGRLAQIAQTTN